CARHIVVVSSAIEMGNNYFDYW
nr:immunoglobulin heavy chain junction region [Macaca mulatta]